MKKNLFPVVIYLATLFTACSDDDTHTDPIQIPQDQKHQTLYADDTDREISFTATAPWTTRIDYNTPTKAIETADWVTLDPASGEAGEITVKLTLLPNYSGSGRRATIRIACGNTSISVIIEQKGEDASGEIPVQQKKIGKVEIRTTETWEEKTSEQKELYTFEYDSQGRLTEQCFQENQGNETIHRISYSTNNQIKVTEKNEDEYWIVGLNEAGAATRLQIQGTYNGYEDQTYSFTYDDQGHLSQESWTGYSTKEYINYHWREDNFIGSVYYKPNEYGGENTQDTLTGAYTYLKTSANKQLNPDPNLFVSTWGSRDGSANSNSYNARKGRMDLLALWGLLGKRSQNYVVGPSAYEGLAFRQDPDVEYYYTYSYTCHPLQYEFDSDGYVVSITDKADKKIYKVINSTGEHLFIREVTDRIVYTFTYKN